MYLKIILTVLYYYFSLIYNNQIYISCYTNLHIKLFLDCITCYVFIQWNSYTNTL